MKKANSPLIGGSVGKGGENKKNDVRAVQTLLNMPANMNLSGLKASLDTATGKLDGATQDAINLYQKNVMNLGKKDQTIDGRVDRAGGMIYRLAQALPVLPSFSYSSPKWLKVANDEEDWQSYGKGGDALVGNICVIEREPFGDSGTGWHVGFFLAGDPRAGYVALLGGNQGNSVCRRWFVGLKDCYQRWPG